MSLFKDLVRVVKELLRGPQGTLVAQNQVFYNEEPPVPGQWYKRNSLVLRKGDLWFDTSFRLNTPFVWNGNAWVHRTEEDPEEFSGV